MTDTERSLWSKIRKKQFAGFRFRRQRPIGPYIIDLVCLEARLVLECDGGQHAQPKEEDAKRTQWLEENGFRVLRFWNIDVFKEWESVERMIIKALTASTATPPTPLVESPHWIHRCAQPTWSRAAGEGKKIETSANWSPKGQLALTIDQLARGERPTGVGNRLK